MELIKIEPPIQDLMEDTLTEQECDDQLKLIREAATSKNTKQIVSEAMDKGTIVKLAIAGGLVITRLIIAIATYIKNKYRITVRRIYSHSKELNDLYTKVNYILQHDKEARRKHKNDLINVTLESIVLVNKNNNTNYNPAIDFIGYNPEYFIQEINKIMKYAESNKGIDIHAMANHIFDLIDEDFRQNHWFIEDTEPTMKVTNYSNIKLESALTYYKNAIGKIYNILYAYNQYATGELEYIQILQIAYKKLIDDFGKDKDSKEVIDSIFKKLIDNITKSMEFNNKSMIIFDEMIHFYAKELENLYNTIRS